MHATEPQPSTGCTNAAAGDGRRILVTGTAGEVGRDLLPQLTARYDATGFDLRPTDGGLKAIQGDLTRIEDIRRAAEGMDAIVHLAALLCRDEPDRSIDLNVKATANALQAAVDQKVRRFVYCSTVWVTGHGQTEPYLPIDEEAPCRAVCMYGQTKWLGELMVDWYARRFGLQTVIIRFCGYHYVKGYTPGGEIDWAAADVPALFLRYLKPGHKLMNPADLGAAFGSALANPAAVGQRFVVGVSTPYGADDAAELRTSPAMALARCYPGVPELLESLGIAIPPLPFFYSHEKARNVLGFRSRHDLGDLARLYQTWISGR